MRLRPRARSSERSRSAAVCVSGRRAAARGLPSLWCLAVEARAEWPAGGERAPAGGSRLAGRGLQQRGEGSRDGTGAVPLARPERRSPRLAECPLSTGQAVAPAARLHCSHARAVCCSRAGAECLQHAQRLLGQAKRPPADRRCS